MSEEMKPEVIEETVVETADVAQEQVVVNYADKTLAELSALFQSLTESEDRMKRSKEAEAIKSAFYKRLAERDHATQQQIRARMAAQLSAEEKMHRADYVILNYEGNPRSRQVQHIHRLLCS